MSDVTAPLQVTVVRSQWLRGEGSVVSKLLRQSDGKMCCMGFACIAAGLSKDEIEGCASVHGLLTEGIDVPTSLQLMAHGRVASPAGQRIYACNDQALYNAEAREANLIQLGKTVDIAFTFVD